MTAYIVLCSKAFAGKDNMFYREFLRFYLLTHSEYATVANEVWDTWKFKIHQQYPTNASQIITHRRGYIRPENNRLNPTTFREPEPKDYSSQLFDKTGDLVKRIWAEVSIFITEEPETYKSLKSVVKMMNLEEFYLSQMETEEGRNLLQQFSTEHAVSKKG